MSRNRRAQVASRYQNDGMTGSTPARLLLAVFDRLRRDLEGARVAIGAGHVEAAHRKLVNAQDLLFELQLALDADVWSGAPVLAAVYDHLMALLVEANLRKRVDLVDQALDVVVPIEKAWIEAHEQLQSQQSTVGSS